MKVCCRLIKYWFSLSLEQEEQQVVIGKGKHREMYLKMLHTRRFEERVTHFISLGLVHGTTHLYVGEEAVAIGACCALETEDLITSTHRGHGQCIGKGIDLNRMMACLLYTSPSPRDS